METKGIGLCTVVLACCLSTAVGCGSSAMVADAGARCGEGGGGGSAAADGGSTASSASAGGNTASSSSAGGQQPQPSCTDMIKNGKETDVDCGGGCSPCANKKHCVVDGDCASNKCKSETCVAEPRIYSKQPEYAKAASCSPIHALWFDGPTEKNGLLVTDKSIMPPYSMLGVDFLPYLKSSVVPYIARGQSYQMNVPGHDGMLINGNSPNPTSDLAGRAFRWKFNGTNGPIYNVGMHVNLGDGGYLEAYDAEGNSIAKAPLSSGGFAGIQTDLPIAAASFFCTFNGDIVCGMYGLQFGGC